MRPQAERLLKLPLEILSTSATSERVAQKAIRLIVLVYLA